MANASSLYHRLLNVAAQFPRHNHSLGYAQQFIYCGTVISVQHADADFDLPADLPATTKLTVIAEPPIIGTPIDCAQYTLRELREGRFKKRWQFNAQFTCEGGRVALKVDDVDEFRSWVAMHLMCEEAA